MANRKVWRKWYKQLDRKFVRLYIKFRNLQDVALKAHNELYTVEALTVSPTEITSLMLLCDHLYALCKEDPKSLLEL